MAEKYYSGRDGKLWMDTTPGTGAAIAQFHKITNWSFNTSTDLLEVTTLGDKWRNYTPGLTGITGSCTVIYYKDQNNRLEASDFLRKGGVTNDSDAVAHEDKIRLSLRLYPGTTGTGFNEFEFNAFITGCSMALSSGDIASVNINFSACEGPTTATL